MRISEYSEKVIFTAEGRTATLFRLDQAEDPLIVITEEEDLKDQTVSALRSHLSSGLNLLWISGADWNHDLSPWNCPAIRKGQPDFTGGADAYLDLILKEIIPQAVKEGGLAPSYYGIAGYSLAGLFALYALYRTDFFSRAASMSGSLWFPDFVKYAESHRLLGKPEKIYLSLGDREDRTRNPLMQPIRENTEKMAGLFRKLGIDSTLEMNPGNHFRDPDIRTAKGIAWILQ